MKTPMLALAPIAAALLCATPIPAAAAPSGQASVSYSDLDLSSAVGRAELASRFDKAARDMCGIDATTEKLHGSARYCYDNASKPLRQRVASILAEHDGKGSAAVAAR